MHEALRPPLTRIPAAVVADLEHATTATTLLGRTLPQPVLLAPVACQGLVHAGALGVAHMLKLLREELAPYMAMTGCARPAAARTAGLLAGAAGDDRC
jgi:isopentenyl diphosphate isomerase/L-lactate dehydrogenase-like FMN-dependent dehydrogenase